MLPQAVQYVLERLEDAGFAAYAVGGCVRDTLLGRTPGDWDVTTAARPEQVLALFDGYAIPTGLKHGTVTVRAGEMHIEVTTFRADGTYTDHRRPDQVFFSDRLEEDLCRRDLTVNAMAMDLRGHITDLYGGREDLEAGILRCVGEPERRFEEDALRILRTLRFAAVLGFSVEPRTDAALRVKAPLLRCIAPERILLEDQSASTEENLAFSAALLREKGLSTDVAIASDNFHQLRAAIWAQRSGLTPQSAGCASPWFLTAGYWARETAALLYMVVTGS